jgi:mannose-6-phosphate isomerase-like protein (cupin superfamily)
MLLNLSDFEGYPRHEKAWGYEIWLTNHALYCAKLLVVTPGWQCSLHCHNIKVETFYVLSGQVDLQYGIDAQVANSTAYIAKAPGDSLHVPAGLWHRFANFGPDEVVLLEVSTYHSDEDVERAVGSGTVLPF